uniref:Acyl-CoA thioesterase 11 n=1 Tax=Nothoprocta perdicaria TaxID=30464 RepID=A0A8C6ZYM2_NOTPE
MTSKRSDASRREQTAGLTWGNLLFFPQSLVIFLSFLPPLSGSDVRRGAPSRLRSGMASAAPRRPGTEVQMSQLVLPCHSNHRGELGAGQLLKWMDTAACLSAERHAGCPCVTASMDDIYFEHTISVGQVVNIKAKVNRAFNSSMEVGIQVSHEELCSGRRWSTCKAFATFVAQGQGDAKVKLKPLSPQTEEEKIEHSIAAERRRMRLAHKDTLKDLLARCPRDTGTAARAPGRAPERRRRR